jgi:hypothetical protein
MIKSVKITFTEAELLAIKSWYGSAHHWYNHRMACRVRTCHSAKKKINGALGEARRRMDSGRPD